MSSGFPLLKNARILLCIGLFCAVWSIVQYHIFGFSLAYVLITVGAVLCLVYLFVLKDTEANRVVTTSFLRNDVLLAVVIVVFFAPLYLYKIDTIPWQVNTDEITITQSIQQVMQAPVDPLGTNANYFHFPNLGFLLAGYAGEALGGITLVTMRMVHALIGLAIIAASFFFFRLWFSRGLAVSAALILGSNHAFLAISRMAMTWNNWAVLAEIIALILLCLAMRNRSLLLSFFGGFVYGLGFYLYYPGRVTLCIWLVAVVIAMWVRARHMPSAQCGGLLLACITGFLLIAGPAVVREVVDTRTSTYGREQFIFSADGRILQQRWSGTDTFAEAYRDNMYNGLLSFNMPISDHGFIYPNYGHGFFDPLSGRLLWAGVLVVLGRVVFRRASLGDVLAGVGFVSLYVAFSFIITKAPNYLRMFVVLPFTTYLIVVVLQETYHALAYVFPVPSRSVRVLWWMIVALLVALVCASNLVSFSDFVRKGFREGNDVGGTLRYVAEKKHIPGYNFYLLADTNTPYYSWGSEYQWKDWMGGTIEGLSPAPVVLGPEESLDISFRVPATIFMNRSVFLGMYGSALKARYPHVLMRDITSDGHLIAVDI